MQQQIPLQRSNRNRLLNALNQVNLKQIQAVILSSSLIFKSFCAALLVGYLITFKENVTQYITVVPGNLLPPNFFLWTLFTHSFVEYRLIELVCDCFLILFYSKMLEPLWGTLECLRFYFLVTILVAISMFFFYLAAFALTFQESYLFSISVHGMGGLLGALSVAVKQTMPDMILIDLSFVRLKQDNLPFLLILASTALSIIGLTDLTYVIMLSSGVFHGWIYLRFFQKHKNGTRGDSSSTFVFAR